MANLIRDLIELHGRPVLSQPLEASQDAIRTSFVPTRDAGRVCTRILQRLASPGAQNGAILLTGPPGSGRTHILRYVELRLADPLSPAWKNAAPGAEPGQRPARALSSLFLSIPASPQIDLASFLCAHIGSRASGAASGDGVNDEGLVFAFDSLAQQHASTGLGLLVLEGFSGRVVRSGDAAGLEKERGVLRNVIDAYSRAGILVVVVLDEVHLRRRGPWRLARLREWGETVPVTRNNLLEVIAAIAVKNDAQRQGIREVLGKLRSNFATLGPNSEDFVELYPVHSSTFDALFRLSAVLPTFSPLHFLQGAIRENLDSPPSRLVTPDRLFDYVEPEMRVAENCRPVVYGYDEAVRDMVPGLKPALRPVATALLKCIAIGGIRNPAGTSIRSLAHQCLPEDASGTLSGYGMVAAVMTQLEELGSAALTAAGEGAQRAYRFRSRDLVGWAAAPERDEARPDRGRGSFPLMLFDWIRSEIPVWNPETSPHYTAESQSMSVPLPDFDPPVKGIVYFKHPLDPLWSESEILAMRSGGASWALLVLSPFESVTDLESGIREVLRAWDRVLVWRPGVPTRRELLRLQKIAPAYRLPVRLTAGLAKAKAQARRTIASLYVSRGVFRTVSDQWHIAEDVSAANLALCVSRSLASLLGAEVSVLAGTAAAIAGEPDRKQKALRWAALMPGPERISDSDPDTAEQNLLAWWASRLEVDCPALITRLHSLPESMITIRMWEEIRVFENSLGLMRSVFQWLRMGEISLLEALQQIAHHFGNDEARIARWRESLDRLAGLARWAPAYEHAHDYLSAAFETGTRAVDEKRAALIYAARQPHHFLEPASRDKFDAGFLDFKREYTEAYASMHRDVLGRIQSKVDTTSLRNLELLSSLPHAETTNWQKVKLIGRWAQRNQCDLPVREILDRYPRCYCNFNPAVKQHLADPGAQINRLVQEGIEHLRTAFRNAKKVIIEDLERLEAGEETSRQIGFLISTGPLVPVGAECVDLLGRIIQDHAERFRKEFHASRPSTRPAS